MIKTDDGDGYTDTVTVGIATAEPTATPKEPGFEAVFANFSFQKEKFVKENIVLLVKLFFLRKGYQSHT